jgi:hypothetical protein
MGGLSLAVRSLVKSLASSVDVARFALLSLLVLLVALGVHGHPGAASWRTGPRLRDGLVAGALELVVISLLVILWQRHRRAAGGVLAERLRKALSYVLGVGAVVLAVTCLLLVPGAATLGTLPRGGQAHGCTAFLRCGHPAPRTPPSASQPFHFPFLDVLYGLGAALLVAAIVASALWASRRAVEGPPVAEALLAEEYGEAPEEILEQGRRAMLGVEDARAAIIACYVAMEERLARAGTVRTSAETPDELLAKVASSWPVSSPAAGRLTSLFYEARFSSHSLGSSRRLAAQKALAELVSELRGAHRSPEVTEA